MVISMKPLRILLNNTVTSGIEPLQSVLAASSHTSIISLACSEPEQSPGPQSLECKQHLFHVTTHYLNRKKCQAEGGVLDRFQACLSDVVYQQRQPQHL